MRDKLNIVLIGFMGTGKSEVGRLLSDVLDMTFVDTDHIIESQTGLTIPDLFKTKGEAEFRAIEKNVVQSLHDATGHVIATGGGAIIDPDNMSVLKSLGPVVHLTATPEVILERTGGDANARPLLAGEDALQRIETLLQSRIRHYAQADVSIDTSTIDIYTVAQQVLLKIDEGAAHTIGVDLGKNSYEIVIGESVIRRLGLMLRSFPLTNRAIVITNPGLRYLYGDDIMAVLRSADFEPIMVEVPEGEAQKSLEWASKIYDAMLTHRMDRKSPVIALGGGVIGDLAGFAAATFMRGVPFIQVPTSLLSQVDASVGGKVAVDHPRGKNLIGAFYQPELVLISLETLNTLSDRELRAGMAEVIKYGIIADETFFTYVENHYESILNRYVNALAHIVARSCEIKAEVVSGDEREQGRRAILNFGHTIGHAIESHTGLIHGEAIAIGMVCEARIAHRMGLIDEESVQRIINLIDLHGLPTTPQNLDLDAVMDTMLLDKKTVGGQLTFILPIQIGEVEIRSDVPEDMIRDVLI